MSFHVGGEPGVGAVGIFQLGHSDHRVLDSRAGRTQGTFHADELRVAEGRSAAEEAQARVSALAAHFLVRLFVTFPQEILDAAERERGSWFLAGSVAVALAARWPLLLAR